MMKTLAMLCGSLLAFTACGVETGSNDNVLDDAVMMAALSQDDEALEEVPDGDPEEAANEAADDLDSDDTDVAGDCSLRGIRRRIVESYDTDGDGELSEEERNALREDLGPKPRRRARWHRRHRLQRLKWIYDANGDRTLDEAERQELRNDLETRCENRKAQLLENFDENGDGELDEDEWLAVREALVTRRAAQRQAVLDAFDVNEDGVLGPMERRAFVEHRRARIQERRQAAKDEFDTDDSGDLDADERAALREALKQRVRGEHFGEE